MNATASFCITNDDHHVLISVDELARLIRAAAEAGMLHTGYELIQPDRVEVIADEIYIFSGPAGM